MEDTEKAYIGSRSIRKDLMLISGIYCLQSVGAASVVTGHAFFSHNIIVIIYF